MFKVRSLVIITATIMYFASCTGKKENLNHLDPVKVVPAPHKVLLRDGVLNLDNDFWVIANVGEQATTNLAETLVEGLEELTSKNIGISDLYSTRKHDQSIQLEIRSTYNSISDDAYTLDISSSHITITASTTNGIYYGIQSMLQILKSTVSSDGFEIQKMIIKDLPKYKIRGVLLNPADYSSEEFLSIISTMMKYKLNSIYVLGNDINIEHIQKNIEGKSVVLNVVATPPNNLTILSYGDSKEELQAAFSANKNSGITEGYLLDLTSSTSGNLKLKLKFLSELAWSENKNRDFSSIIEQF